jgi:hypothetical protein
MSVVHRVVIASSIFSAVGMWLALRGLPDVSSGEKVLYTLFPAASIASACYCVCMVFNCLGRR